MDDPAEAIAMLQQTLGIGAELAGKLVEGGFSTIEEVAYVPFDELKEVCCLPESEARNLRELARRHLLNI
jgi:N utilization substance protein A